MSLLRKYLELIEKEVLMLMVVLIPSIYNILKLLLFQKENRNLLREDINNEMQEIRVSQLIIVLSNLLVKKLK